MPFNAIDKAAEGPKDGVGELETDMDIEPDERVDYSGPVVDIDI